MRSASAIPGHARTAAAQACRRGSVTASKDDLALFCQFSIRGICTGRTYHFHVLFAASEGGGQADPSTALIKQRSTGQIRVQSRRKFAARVSYLDGALDGGRRLFPERRCSARNGQQSTRRKLAFALIYGRAWASVGNYAADSSGSSRANPATAAPLLAL